jgi:hypothetical protein
MASKIEMERLNVEDLLEDLDPLLYRLEHFPGSEERAVALAKLKEVVTWLGKDLKRINEERRKDEG